MVNRIPPRANIPSANAYAQVDENQTVNPTARGATLGQPRGNRMQQRAQRLAELTEAVNKARIEFVAADKAVPRRLDCESARGLLDPCNSLIEKVDALEAEAFKHREKVFNNKQLASVLCTRAYIYHTMLRSEGGLELRVLNSFKSIQKSPNYFKSYWFGNHEKYDNQLDKVLTLCDEVSKLQSLERADYRRAFELDPSDQKQLSIIRRQVVNSISHNMCALFIVAEQVQCKAADLGSLLGEPAGQLFTQSKILGSYYQMLDNLLSDTRVDEMRPILTDIRTVCLDFAAFVMDLALPEPSSNHTVEQISQVKCMLDCAVGHCLDLSDLISQWNVDHPRSGSDGVARKLSTRTDGGFVSVRAANGMHVPAQVQPNGELSAVGLELELIAPSPSSDVNVSEADEAQTGSEEDSVSDSGSVRASSRAAKTLQKGLDLIASDFEKEFRNVTDRKGYSDPDILIASYTHHAEKWQVQAESMRSIADKLVSKFSNQTYDTEEQTQASRELPGRLQERASVLESKAQELLRPETRWSLIKSYVRPQAQQWSELFDAQQINRVGVVTELASTTSNANPIFEMRIQALPDADGTRYPPVWLHLHPTQRMTVQQVSKAKFDRFDAVHLKSDADKNRGQRWVQAQRASGNLDADVHRSKVDADLFNKIMSFDKPVIPKRGRAAKK